MALLFRIGSVWWMELKAEKSFHAALTFEFETAKQARACARKLGIRVKRVSNCDRTED